MYYNKTVDIWLSRCNKTSTCDYCKQPITVGEPEVFGKLWLRFTKEGSEPRRWVKKFHWHGKRKIDGVCCWLEQALEEFSKRPYVEMRGRKKILMSKEERQKRLSILMRRARVMQRLRAETESGSWKADVVIHLGSLLEQLKEEISIVGGVPKSWE